MILSKADRQKISRSIQESLKSFNVASKNDFIKKVVMSFKNKETDINDILDHVDISEEDFYKNVDALCDDSYNNCICCS